MLRDGNAEPDPKADARIQTQVDHVFQSQVHEAAARRKSTSVSSLVDCIFAFVAYTLVTYTAFTNTVIIFTNTITNTVTNPEAGDERCPDGGKAEDGQEDDEDPLKKEIEENDEDATTTMFVHQLRRPLRIEN